MIRGVLYGALFVAIMFLVPAVKIQAGGGKGPPLPPARQVPGITAEDQFPNGCVDCHIIQPGINLDVRLSSVMRPWKEQVDQKTLAKAQASSPKGMVLKGKHPAVDYAFKDIPAACLKCHGKTSKQAPPFSEMLHAFHLTGGGENPFMTLFQAECTHCHKLNLTTGALMMPSAPEK